MDDTPTMEPREAPRRTRTRPGGKGMLWGLLAVVIAFSIGFFWQFYQATTVRQTLAATEQDLMVERLRAHLANAALAAQGGRYEAARIEMSSFFNRAQTQQPALPDPLRGVTSEFLGMRDDVITGLSRADPAYGAVLFGMLQRFEEALPRTDETAPVNAGREARPGEPAPADAAREVPTGEPDAPR